MASKQGQHNIESGHPGTPGCPDGGFTRLLRTRQSSHRIHAAGRDCPDWFEHPLWRCQSFLESAELNYLRLPTLACCKTLNFPFYLSCLPTFNPCGLNLEKCILAPMSLTRLLRTRQSSRRIHSTDSLHLGRTKRTL